MTNAIISFLVLLNPVGIFIFLHPLLKKMSTRELMKVLALASFFAAIVFLLFTFTGDALFRNVLQVRFDSFRIFGGMVIAFLSFQIIVLGKKSFITYSEDHSAVANEIAMPLMIGAGTISICILMGTNYSKMTSSMAVILVMAINYVVIITLAVLRNRVAKKVRAAFDKNMEYLLRMFAFFGGAIGTEMVVVGIKRLFF